MKKSRMDKKITLKPRIDGHKHRNTDKNNNYH